MKFILWVGGHGGHQRSMPSGKTKQGSYGLTGTEEALIEPLCICTRSCLHVMAVSLVFVVGLLIVGGHVSLIFTFALESLFSYWVASSSLEIRSFALSYCIFVSCFEAECVKGRGDSATVWLLFLGGLLFSQAGVELE